jgi:hypothetical protein
MNSVCLLGRRNLCPKLLDPGTPRQRMSRPPYDGLSRSSRGGPSCLWRPVRRRVRLEYGTFAQTGNAPSNFAAWILRSARSQWPYVSVVTLSEEWPRCRESHVI